MPKRVTERRLCDVLVAYYRGRHAVAREVQHYEKRIDVVVVCAGLNQLWAIEAKVSDWKRAVRQAVVNLAVAERSYIAMYRQNAHRVPWGYLHQRRIGLIEVGTRWGDVAVTQPAESSVYVNHLANVRMRAAVEAEHGKWKRRRTAGGAR